jgi:gamma-glutamylcysteine synthetase
MSAPPQEKGAPITDRRQLIEFLEGGCKPKPAWRIGTEHEKFGYTHDETQATTAAGSPGRAQARLRRVSNRYPRRVAEAYGGEPPAYVRSWRASM